MTTGETGDAGDSQATGPDGQTYRVVCRRRGESLRDWDGADTALPLADLVVFMVSLFARLVSLVRVRASHGRTIAIFREGNVRAKIVHREHVADELVEVRLREVTAAVESGSLPR